MHARLCLGFFVTSLMAACVLFFIAGLVPIRADAAAPDPVAGQKFARIECGGCHAVAEKPGKQPPPQAQGAAPHFATLARDPAMTEAKIRETLKLPHGSMANLVVSEKDTANIISYIETLQSH